LKTCNSWRDLLKQIIDHKQEHQRIALAMHIHPITLTRWAAGMTSPRPGQIRSLLNALPAYREQLSELIIQCDPDLLIEVTSSLEEYFPELPSTFYAEVLECYRKSPPLIRAFTIRVMIVQQMLLHLDPQQQGIEVFLTQCVPPVAGKRVHSCYAIIGRGTPPWNRFSEYQTCFFGAETQVGSTIMSGRPFVFQSREQQIASFPTDPFVWGESTATYPVRISGRIAGGLCVISAQPQAFSSWAIQEIIQQYADLLVLGFETEAFYDLGDIQFGVMPPAEKQESILAGFQQRIVRHLLQANQMRQSLTRAQAEYIALQEMEEELLSGSSSI
jgi:hypothetical protein